MSLAHVILGLLQQQERTGYDLKTSCFDDCIAHIWQADQAQIYRTLNRLEAQGWITCTLEIQHDRPNRKVYSVTTAGEAQLGQWLQTHQASPIVREPLLVQLYFGAVLSNEAIAQLLEKELETHRQQLSKCEAIATLPTATREDMMHQLVLDLIRRREQLYLNWLKDAIVTMTNGDQGT